MAERIKVDEEYLRQLGSNLVNITKKIKQELIDITDVVNKMDNNNYWNLNIAGNSDYQNKVKHFKNYFSAMMDMYILEFQKLDKFADNYKSIDGQIIDQLAETVTKRMTGM